VFERYWRHISVAAAVLQDPSGAVVLVENVRRQGRREWSLPAGVLDPGETLLETAAREVEEEAGVKVTEWAGFAYAVHRILEPQEIQLVVTVFAAATWEGELRADDPDGIVESVELTPADGIARRMPDPAFHEPLLAWIGDHQPRFYEYAWSGSGLSVRRA
jgi:8-oxo-dGTP pyrophosphatase MutT (NUDIX family)